MAERYRRQHASQDRRVLLLARPEAVVLVDVAERTISTFIGSQIAQASCDYFNAARSRLVRYHPPFRR
jgi:hypothetical protein